MVGSTTTPNQSSPSERFFFALPGYGPCFRAIALPYVAIADQANARFDNGDLEMVVPAPDSAQKSIGKPSSGMRDRCGRAVFSWSSKPVPQPPGFSAPGRRGPARRPRASPALWWTRRSVSARRSIRMCRLPRGRHARGQRPRGSWPRVLRSRRWSRARAATMRNPEGCRRRTRSDLSGCRRSIQVTTAGRCDQERIGHVEYEKTCGKAPGDPARVAKRRPRVVREIDGAENRDKRVNVSSH